MARTVCWYRRAAFLIALVLGLGTQGALAQPYTQEGETEVARAAEGIADANGDIVKFRDMTIRWRFDVMMGSPLRQFAGRYTHYDPPWVELSGVQTCFAGRRIGAFRPLKLEPQMLTAGVLDQNLIYAHTRFNMIIQPNARLSFMISGMGRVIQHEFMVDTFTSGSEYGLSVPGSPSWDRMFQYGFEGAPDNPWLTEGQTKELFEVGFKVSRIDMIEPRYALTLARASYERHFGASACGDEPAQTVAEVEEQDSADESESEDRVEAMLERIAAAQEAAVRQEGAGDPEDGGMGASGAQDSFAVRQGEARIAHAEAIETCNASRPAAPYMERPQFALMLSVSCSQNCPTPAQQAAADARASAARIERERQMSERNAQRQREHAAQLAIWESSTLPRCLAQAESRLDAELAAIERERRNIETLQTILPNLRGQPGLNLTR